MEFLPDGRMLLCEKGGAIRIAEGPDYNSSSLYMTITDIESGQERGLIDIVIDPNFAANNYFYVYYSKNSTNKFRIARFLHQENSGGLTSTGDLSSEFLVYEDTDTWSSCCHYGGGLDFGPDGTLYCTIGDEFNGNQAQDLTRSGGKVIRVNSDGSIPADNPLVDGPGGNHDAIFAYGLRNPFRSKWDIPGNRYYIAEVGGNVQSTAMEDVHIGVSGADHGWPYCEGSNCSWPSGEPANFSAPLYSYPHTAGTPNGGSITGGFVYRGNQFPSSFIGAYFFGDYAIEYIRYLTLDGSGNLTGDFDFQPSAGLVVAIDQGPDGALYYCDISGSVRRIVYDNGNQGPTCVTVTSSTSNAQAGVMISFDADVEDAEGEALDYEWQWGDGTTTTGSIPAGPGVRSLPTEMHAYG
ncbi:MAG: PQQ-dependent sugar dehydrogenase, partial [Phaeodactylibacter sp.]|nr:PQQ-dependent sugar dehydrogenase [Phaeodactylibacter sp.]